MRAAVECLANTVATLYKENQRAGVSQGCRGQLEQANIRGVEGPEELLDHKTHTAHYGRV